MCSFRGIIVRFFWFVGLLNGFCPLVGVFPSFHCLSVWRWKTSICTVPWSHQRLFISLFLLISPLFSAISVFFLSFRVCVWCSTLVSVFRYCICDLSNHCCYCYYSKMKPSTRRSPRSSAPSGEAASSPTAKAKVSFVYAFFDLWCVWTVFVFFFLLSVFCIFMNVFAIFFLLFVREPVSLAGILLVKPAKLLKLHVWLRMLALIVGTKLRFVLFLCLGFWSFQILLLFDFVCFSVLFCISSCSFCCIVVLFFSGRLLSVCIGFCLQGN